MEGDAARWDDRHRSAVPARPSPPDALVGLDDGVIPRHGRMLDVACGLGAQAVWGAQRGLQVTAIDASAVAIERALALAADHGVSIDAHAIDLDDPNDHDHLGGPFELVVCQRFRDPRLFPMLVDALAPGGLLVVTLLSSVGCDAPGPFHAPPGELAAAFGRDPRLEVLRASEGDGEASVVARRRQGTDTVV